MNPKIRKAEYAVRGELAIRSEKLKVDLANGASHPFERVVGCNIGNPQALEQKPITFFRQVASLVEYPDLLKDENAELTSKLYASDAIARAKLLLKHIGSVGAYSHSQGIPQIRENVARFISERDGYPADPSMIFLTQGASAGVQLTLQMIVEHSNVGIMIPIPQYPLYTATLAVLDAQPVPYYLDESKGWGLTTEELQRAYDEAAQDGIETRALVIINPGNPTGQCLSDENMCEIIRFCQKNKVILLADEVYQTNIYEPEQRPFHSFKKILKSMGPEFEGLELISFHSVSKGMIGECGRRGGYFECEGLCPTVLEQIYKISSISLCPNVQGQIMVDLMVNPPKKGDPSYLQYKQEYDAIYFSLIKRAKKLEETFNSLEGCTCNSADGAMYLFPHIRLPKKAIAAAKEAGKFPDQFYCMAMLEATGVCMVAGSGFGQVEGTAHFRSTFLPQPEFFDDFCTGIKDFHASFMNKYRD
ncbi:pyridoxal phosphate-dependent transferase [Gamsiella multidivaricata]|uniref:pyridoxal phosphate-dependent transferase n=1 Tax=Gamsiella multidivaricata TaxID=101098 RepID=UPI0022207BA1|nr:pyridoxal phosphate-dependent transferase [Gamsiella multidivaricata]KAI7820682.1 pyridoxal phosphate-dependent transferase [Gamsiella multidivaricata]